MCLELRMKYRIPDEYQKDMHLGNWLKKNLVPNLVAVFIDDKASRGTISKSCVEIGDRDLILCLESGLTFNIKSEGLLQLTKV